MKIKSQFKDYYDYVQHLFGGGDEKITYERRRIGEFKDLGTLRYAAQVEVNAPKISHLIAPFVHIDRYLGHFNWLVVCGKPYPLVNNGPKNDAGYIYPDKWEVVDPSKHSHLVISAGRRSWLFETNYTEIGKEDPTLVVLSRLVGHPVFVITSASHNGNESKVVVDGNCPVLEQMGFPSIYPAEQLYQDLSYFIVNLMNPSPDMQPPTTSTDKEKIQQHGFDVKKSFRHRKD